MASSGSFKTAEEQFKSMSVFSYFTCELTRGYLLEREEEKYAQKRQRVYTFMKTPRELEKFSSYGFFQCLDAFLFIFTFLPLRIILAVLKIFTVPCGFMRSRHFLEPSQICDILKGVILLVCTFIIGYIDTSMIYHLVRGQATIKLYVFFNMLDMADRLLSNFGHDILDALFWTATEPRGKRREHLGTLPHLLIAIIYVIIHTLLILFQATVLNVAFNSHNKSLLVIMMSNNFVEIKSNLFKKVDVNHLYQIACSDVKERFHYVVLLSVVCVRNMNEVSWDTDHLWVLLPDAIMVLFSEVLVDWGKHAFILKFNEIPADVYREFKVKLALDMATSRQSQAFTDHSDLVSRRMGLTPLPLACLLYKILSKSVRLTSWMDYFILFMLYLCLMTFKVLNSIVLLGHSYSVIENYHNAQAETESTNQKSEKSTNQSPEKSANEKQENNLPTNQNHLSAQQSFTAETLPFESHSQIERRLSDSKVSRNFSQIFSADSYTELTMVPDSSAIEQTGGFTMNMKKAAVTPCDSDYSEQEVESVPYDQASSHDQSSESHDLSNQSHDQNMAGDHSKVKLDFKATEVAGLHKTATENESMLQGHTKAHKAVPNELHGATVFQRTSKSFFMNFGIKKIKKFGSSISLPETVGIPEDLENEDASQNNSPTKVSSDKSEKSE